MVARVGEFTTPQFARACSGLFRPNSPVFYCYLKWNLWYSIFQIEGASHVIPCYLNID